MGKMLKKKDKAKKLAKIEKERQFRERNKKFRKNLLFKRFDSLRNMNFTESLFPTDIDATEQFMASIQAEKAKQREILFRSFTDTKQILQMHTELGVLPLVKASFLEDKGGPKRARTNTLGFFKAYTDNLNDGGVLIEVNGALEPNTIICVQKDRGNNIERVAFNIISRVIEPIKR